MNDGGDEFADERLLASHRSASRQAAAGTARRRCCADVKAFCGEAAQNDDVTILGVHYSG